MMGAHVSCGELPPRGRPPKGSLLAPLVAVMVTGASRVRVVAPLDLAGLSYSLSRV
jgi:hypothetical protein